MTIGVYGFYTVQMVFGIWEGSLMMSDPAAMAAVHHWYGRLAAIAGTLMAGGFLAYFANLTLTMLRRPVAVPVTVARISE